MEYKNNDSEIYKKEQMDQLHKEGEVFSDPWCNCNHCWRAIDGMRYRRRNKKQRTWKSKSKRNHQWKRI